MVVEDLAANGERLGLDIRGGLEAIGIFLEALGHGGVEHRVGRRQVELASRHAELEAVAGKGKRRRAIAVGVVLLERGKHLAAQVHAPHLVRDGVLARRDGVDDARELVAQED